MNAPRYLMHPGAARLISSRNNHTGEVTRYVEIHRPISRRRISGLVCMALAGVIVAGMVIGQWL